MPEKKEVESATWRVGLRSAKKNLHGKSSYLLASKKPEQFSARAVSGILWPDMVVRRFSAALWDDDSISAAAIIVMIAAAP